MNKIKKDFIWYKQNSLSKSAFAVFINPCFYSLLLYRISNFMYKHKGSLIAKIIWFINRIIFNIDIDYRANISEEVMIVHGLGIVIGHEVFIEKRVKIYQGVTIGGNNSKTRIIEDKEISQPIIKSGAILCPNSVIIGPIVIGENATIGACTVVTKDIEDGQIYYRK